MRITRSATVVAIVFAGGAGLGFTWRQGWLPVEVLSPQTGVLDEVEQTSPADFESSAPLATAPQEEVSADLVQFEGLTEPPPLTTPLTIPGVVVEPAATTSPVSEARNRQPGPLAPSRTLEPVVPAAATDTVAVVQPASASTIESIGGDASGSRNDPASILAEHKELSRIYWREPQRRQEIQERLAETARLIFFSPQPHFVEPHVIQPGDRLETIAAKHKLSWEYLSRLNNVDPKRIQAGRRLKLVRGPFAAVVELADFSLTVHLQGYYVKRYPVGIGKDGSTPVGTFPVLNKVVNPQYTDPNGQVIDGDDPSNPLGERWIDLGNSYGIHGTIEPDSIGRAASRGCLRLRDADIIEVYDFLVVGSEVVIR